MAKKDWVVDIRKTKYIRDDQIFPIYRVSTENMKKYRGHHRDEEKGWELKSLTLENFQFPLPVKGKHGDEVVCTKLRMRPDEAHIILGVKNWNAELIREAKRMAKKRDQDAIKNLVKDYGSDFDLYID